MKRIALPFNFGPMKYFIFILIPFVLFSCAGSISSEANNTEEKKPFPKKYKGFYAGMSVQEFNDIAYDGRFTILSERKDWTTNIENRVVKPGLTIYLDGVEFTADFWESQVAKITMEGKNIPEFKLDLQEIADNFDNAKGSGRQLSYYDNDIKTSVNLSDGILKLTKFSLNDILHEECSSRQKIVDEMVEIEEEKNKTKIQNKYQ
ncbi:MAG: hypothetical protein ACI8ZM_000569 [Crocinitomix sp.]